LYNNFRGRKRSTKIRSQDIVTATGSLKMEVLLEDGPGSSEGVTRCYDAGLRPIGAYAPAGRAENGENLSRPTH